MTDNQQPTNTEQQDKCPLCGGEVGAIEIKLIKELQRSKFFYQNKDCGFTFELFLPLAEARARFRKRPENEELKAFDKLKEEIIYNYENQTTDDDFEYGKYTAFEKLFNKLEEIEKELKEK